MVRNGLEALVVSQVKMLPLAWPPAIVLWSAEMAMEVMGPDSTAVSTCQHILDDRTYYVQKATTFSAWPNDHLQILIVIKH